MSRCPWYGRVIQAHEPPPRPRCRLRDWFNVVEPRFHGPRPSVVPTGVAPRGRGLGVFCHNGGGVFLQTRGPSTKGWIKQRMVQMYSVLRTTVSALQLPKSTTNWLFWLVEGPTVTPKISLSPSLGNYSTPKSQWGWVNTPMGLPDIGGGRHRTTYMLDCTHVKHLGHCMAELIRCSLNRALVCEPKTNHQFVPIGTKENPK